MRIKIIVVIQCAVVIFCMALFLTSCGSEDISDFVNEYLGINNARTINKTAVMPIDGFTRYEAEDAIIFGGSIRSADAFLYSGGKYVNNLNNNMTPTAFPQNWDGRNYVKFPVIVKDDGVYILDLVTNNGDEGNRIIIIRVNDIVNVSHEITKSTAWDRMIVEQFKLSLWKGLNFICITGYVATEGGQWMNIDCIDVSDEPVLTASLKEAKLPAYYEGAN